MTLELAASIVVFLISYGFIVTERIEPAIAAILGGCAMVLFGLLPHHDAVEAVDLHVLFLLTGMMIIVAIVSQTGLFEWGAIVVAQKARGDGLVILLGLLTVTGLFSAFLDNVTTMVLIAPITILITQILRFNPVPFLILEAIASNIGGAATLVGDPPNILVGSHAGLSFNQFIYHLTPVVVVSGGCFLAAVALIVRNRFSPPAEARREILRAESDRAITDPALLRRCTPVVAATFIGFCTSQFHGVEPGFIALGGGFVLVLATGQTLPSVLREVDWETIYFLIGLFLLVGGLEHAGLFEILGHALAEATAGQPLAAVLAVLWLSGLLSATLGAIPVTMAMIPLVETMRPALDTLPDNNLLWWALALGACFGSNGSVVGAAANIIAVRIAAQNQHTIRFSTFTAYGTPVTLVTLVIASVCLYLRYFWLGG